MRTGKRHQLSGLMWSDLPSSEAEAENVTPTRSVGERSTRTTACKGSMEYIYLVPFDKNPLVSVAWPAEGNNRSGQKMPKSNPDFVQTRATRTPRKLCAHMLSHSCDGGLNVFTIQHDRGPRSGRQVGSTRFRTEWLLAASHHG